MRSKLANCARDVDRKLAEDACTGFASAGSMRLLAALVFVAGTLGVTTSTRAADSITIDSAGGAYQDALREAIWKPVEKKLGVTLNEDTGTGQLTEVRVQVK